jgi:hypothetical protein
MVDLRMWGGIQLACASAPAAAITLSLGVTLGFVTYLCLKKAAPEMRVARVVTDQNFQHRECSVEVLRTNACLQC